MSDPACTITLINNTEYGLTFGETSPEDPNSTLVPAKNSSGPGRGVLTVTDTGTIEVVAFSDYLAEFGWNSTPKSENKANFDIDLDRNTVDLSKSAQSGDATQFEAIVENPAKNLKQVVCFLSIGDSRKLVSVPATDEDSTDVLFGQATGYFKAHFSTRDFATANGGGFVHFRWNGPDSLSKTVTADPKTIQTDGGSLEIVVLTLS